MLNSTSAAHPLPAKTTGRAAQPQDSTPIITPPVALFKVKRGRRCCVAKLVKIDRRPVLAVVWRHQQGTATTISVPLAAVTLAERAGAGWFAIRDDRNLTMRRISLANLRRQGILQADGEIYVKLADMAPCPWRSWAFATTEHDLDADEPEADPW